MYVNDESMDNPKSGGTCIKVKYSAKQTNKQGWAGVYWQNPANNWGDKKGGYDLTGFNKLVFSARGTKGGEVISKVKIGGIGVGSDKPYPDSTDKEAGPFELTTSWQEFSVNLTGLDLTYLNGALGLIFSADQNAAGAEICLDDVYFTYDAALKADAGAAATQTQFPFFVYADKGSLDNHYVPAGFMGDFGDVKIEDNSTEQAFSGKTSIKITYSGKGTQGARWTGVYWQNPANNWGSKDGGYNLSGATKLVFMAKGAKGGERIEEFKMGGIMGEYSDSDAAGVGPIILTNEWKEYTIDLTGKDLSYVLGGFCWVTNADVNPEGATFYLDDIKYVK
jgi:hypothetical protein